MRAKVFTLRFSSQLGRFDDGELVALQRRVVLEHLREHVITTAGETMLACVATWQERTGSTASHDSAPLRNDKPSTTPPPRHVAVADPEPITAPQSTGPATPLEQLRAEFTEEQRNLFDLVRRWRARTAHDEGAPAYVVLTNRQLVEIVRQRPRSKAGLGAIHGLGDKKIDRYGAQLLAVLWPEAPPTESADSSSPTREAAS
jgi:superfamily II DNA helicase RecQ